VLNRNRGIVVGLVAALGAGLLWLSGPESAATAADASALPTITDAQGRTLILRGLNTASSAKSAPDGMPWITEADVRSQHAKLGDDFVRFLIQWRDVEPQAGVFDQDYLAKVAERVSWYEMQGIYVMLDMHQDVYGPAVHGNGAPAWATESDGLPVVAQDDWSETYVQPGVVRAFDNFWNTTGNGTYLQDQYAEAWARVAAYFKDDPGVIAYDLMNEPFGGSLTGPEFESGPLSTVYQKCVDAIRRAGDTKAWIMLEPNAGSVNWGFPSGLRKIHDPRSGGQRLVYAPHLYPFDMDLGSSYAGAKGNVDAAISAWEKHAKATAARLGAPLFLGEFGEDLSQSQNPDYLRKMIATTGRMGVGFAWWSNDKGTWGPELADGTETALLPILAQPYPRAIAGTPTGIAYREEPKTLTFSYRQAKGVTAPTTVYLPPALFPNGAAVGSALDPAGSYSSTFDAATGVLSITADPTLAAHQFTLTPA
jgi:endoglycosylceramidase